MKTRRLIVILSLIGATLGAAPERQTIKFHLNPMHGSGERGMATIAQRGTALIVSITITGAPRGSVQYAHLHGGTCEHVASPAVYVLQPVRSGHSLTRLEYVGLDAIVRGMYSILIHRSLKPSSEHVACGTIAGA